jgi:hypothetical protein
MGNLIATRLFYAAMQRPPGSAPYRLILDEARFFKQRAAGCDSGDGPGLQSLADPGGAVFGPDVIRPPPLGRVDEHLRETALNNARYFSIFHNAADAERLARLILSITRPGGGRLQQASGQFRVPAGARRGQRT